MIYEWDPKKARQNLKKHRVSFDEAVSVFSDPFALTFDDPDHSTDETRFITIGTSGKNRVLFVSHADQGEDHVQRRDKVRSLCLPRVSPAPLMTCGRSTTWDR